MFFGPVAYSLETADLIIYSDPLKWGIADTYIPQFVISSALYKKKKVISVPIDFIYSSEQRKEEETTLNEIMKEKRLNQYYTTIEAHRKLSNLI